MEKEKQTISGWIDTKTGETGKGDSTGKPVPNKWWQKLWQTITFSRQKTKKTFQAGNWEFYGTISLTFRNRICGLFTSKIESYETTSNASVYVNHTTKEAKALCNGEKIEIDYNSLIQHQKFVVL